MIHKSKKPNGCKIRTDLCLEAVSMAEKPMAGIRQEQKEAGELTITKMQVRTKEAAKKLEKQKGNYITVELPHFAHNPVNSKEAVTALSEEIRALLPKAGSILVLGIGNKEITPDALGPMTANGVLATNHIEELGLFRSVCVLCPGVLSQTGMELARLMKWIADALEPSAVLAIDALAAADAKRLGCTVQLTDTGISPGSGVANARTALNFESIGIPVIGIGVPTVTDASALLYTLTGTEQRVFRSDLPPENLMVTPRDVDLMVRRASIFLSTAINCALQDQFSPEELHYLLA